jgi:hypothetical protein
MATENLTIRVYDSSWGIDSSLSPIVDIFELPTNTQVVNDGAFSYSSVLMMYEYDFTTRDEAKEYICNVDFWIWATTRYASFKLEVVTWGGWGGGGWLTEAQANHLMKLRNGGWGGAIIDGKSIEDFLKKWNAPLIRSIEKLPEEIKTKLDEKISEENTLAEEKLSDIIESKDQEIEKALWVVDEITRKTEGTIEEMKTIAIQIKQNSEKFTHNLEVKELEKDIQEETKWLKEAHEKKVDDEVKALETEIQIQDEVQKLAKEAQIQEEIKTLESNF